MSFSSFFSFYITNCVLLFVAYLCLSVCAPFYSFTWTTLSEINELIDWAISCFKSVTVIAYLSSENLDALSDSIRTVAEWRRNRGFRRFNEPGPPSSRGARATIALTWVTKWVKWYTCTVHTRFSIAGEVISEHKQHQNSRRLGLRPRSHWASLQRSPKLRSWWGARCPFPKTLLPLSALATPLHKNCDKYSRVKGTDDINELKLLFSLQSNVVCTCYCDCFLVTVCSDASEQ